MGTARVPVWKLYILSTATLFNISARLRLSVWLRVRVLLWRVMVFSVLVGDRAGCRSVQVSGNRWGGAVNPEESGPGAGGCFGPGSLARSAFGASCHWAENSHSLRRGRAGCGLTVTGTPPVMVGHLLTAKRVRGCGFRPPPGGRWMRGRCGNLVWCSRGLCCGCSVSSRAGVPVDLVAWLVTGEWSSPALRCDVVFTGAGWSRLPGL